MEQRRDLEVWLDDALASYGEASVPAGFEARMLAKLRERGPSRVPWRALTWAGACAVMVVVIVALAAIPRTSVETPSPLRAQIVVPQVQKVTLVAGSPQPVHTKFAPASTRGVPVVAVPLTSQEEAILRMVRNARARQLASLTADRGDVRLGDDIIGFRELQIPPVTREEEK